MAHVVDHLSIAELEERYRACADACSARHYQTIWLLAQGHTIVEVAELTSFVPRWIEELLARYNRVGCPGAGRSSSQQWQHGLGAQVGASGATEAATARAASGWRSLEQPQGRRLDG